MFHFWCISDYKIYHQPYIDILKYQPLLHINIQYLIWQMSAGKVLTPAVINIFHPEGLTAAQQDSISFKTASAILFVLGSMN
jgi:hypothetical protein